MAEKEHDDLTCSVCLEEFKHPKVLLCCHTFCRGCLESLLEKSGQKETLICPQCRAEHGVPAGGIGAFSTDFTVLQTFRIRSLTAKRKSCGMCSSSRDIASVSFCEECEEYLCEYCSDAHKRMKVFADHNVVDPSEFKFESFNPKPKPYYCQLHPQNVVQFFCETCNRLLCGNCVVHSRSMSADGSKHSGHTLTTLSDCLKPMEEDLEKLIDSANCDLKQCESNLYSLEKIEERQEHHTQQLKAQINTAVDWYIQCLQASRMQTLNEIDAKISQESKNTKTQKQHLKSTITHLNSSLKFGLKALKCHNDTERVAMIGHAVSQFKQPTKLHKPVVPIKIEPPLVVEDLEKILQSLLREFQSSDLSIVGESVHAQLGEKSHLKVTICVKPVGNPQFLIKYGPSYCRSLTPQATLKSDKTWLLEFTPCCGGRHAVSACVYGYWTSFQDYWDTVFIPTFYVEGRLKEGDMVCRIPIPDRFSELLSFNTKETAADKETAANQETGKVTRVEHSTSKAGNLTCKVQVKWIKGEEEKEESFRWGDICGHTLELVL